MPERRDHAGDDQDDLSDDLARLVAETRATSAIRARARERSLRQQATATATFSGVLLDLAEADAEVTTRTRGGWTLRGRVTTVGRDFVVLRSAMGGDTFVPLRALTAIRRRPGDRPTDTTGDRRTPSSLSLVAHLADLAPDRPRISVAVDGEPEVLKGELLAVGTDVVTMRLDGDPPPTGYLAVPSLSWVTVLASG
jgi:hypothetical protein